MKRRYKNIKLLLFFLGLFVLVVPNGASANELNFGKIIDRRGNNVVIEYRSLDGREYFECNTAPIECKAFSSDFFPADVSLSDKHSLISPDGGWAISQKPYAVSSGNSIHLTSTYRRNKDGQFEFLNVLPVYNRVERAVFSEAGDKVAVFMSGSVFVLDLQTAKLIHFASFNRGGALRLTLSPTGRYIAAYYSAGTGGERVHRIFDVASGKKYDLRANVDYWDLLTEELTLFDFSPDGTELLYLDDRDGFPSLYLVDLRTLDTKGLVGERLITRKYSVSDFEFLGKNDILFSANRNGPHEWNLYRYNPTTAKLSLISKNLSYVSPMGRIGDHVYFYRINEDHTHPVLFDPTTETIEEFPVPASVLRTEATTINRDKTINIEGGLYGVLMEPDQNQDGHTPLFVWLHGGPYRQTSNGIHSYFSYASYDKILEELRDAGAFVLKLDYTGSYGYGRDFAENIKNNIGKVEVEDTLKAVQRITLEKDISNVYLIGNSYGGYLAMRTLVEDPNKFAGAISINGVVDWEVLLFRLENSIFNIHFGGLPSPSNRHLYEQASILNRAPKLTNQKIFLFQGDDDITVHPEQSELAFKIFEANKKNVELISYPETGHTIIERPTLEDMCQKISALAGLSARCTFE